MTNSNSKTFHSLYSIYYESDGFNIKGEKLMGRQAAGLSFLKGIIQSDQYDDFGVYIRSLNDREVLKEQLNELISLSKKTKDVSIIPYEQPLLTKPFGGIQLPGPVLNQFAKIRGWYGHSEYSLVGITHTTASHLIMSGISSLLTEPIMPWDAIICTSNSVYETVSKIINAQKEFLSHRYNTKIDFLPKLPILPLGINCNEFDYSDEYINQSRKELGINENDIVISYVGRLSFHAKAHHIPMYLALENCAKLLGSDKKIHLIQTGWFANEFIENEFKSDSRSICPSVNCIFLNGKDQNNKKQTLAACDIFISLSDNIQETYGLTPLEAMASGKPVIVSDWNGYRTSVRDGEDGFLIKSLSLQKGHGEQYAYDYMLGKLSYDMYIGSTVQNVAIDVKDCINKLMILINDKEKRKKIGLQGKKRANDDFSWNTILSQYEELYSELNSIRTSENTKFKAFSNKIIPSDRMDPFYLFGEYPTDQITSLTNISLNNEINVLDLNTLYNSSSVNYISTLPNQELIDNVLSNLEKEDILDINQITKIIEEDEEEVMKAVIFLIKYGFVTTLTDKNE